MTARWSKVAPGRHRAPDGREAVKTVVGWSFADRLFDTLTDVKAFYAGTPTPRLPVPEPVPVWDPAEPHKVHQGQIQRLTDPDRCLCKRLIVDPIHVGVFEAVA